MDLAGVLPPITTPFVPTDGSIDHDALARNAERWVTTGLRGLVALGSNGEAPLLDEAESDRVVETVRKAVPSTQLLIAGTGRESTRAAVDASRRAASLGADAVLVRTPSFFKPQMSSQVFVDHYTAIAESCPVPVILYNFTALTGVCPEVSVVAELSEHPNIVGMKESGGDAGYVSALVDESADGFQVLVGSAPTFYSSLLCGAAGGIMAAACVAPEQCVELYQLVRGGRLDEARRLQRQMTPLARLVTRRYGVPGLKAALDLIGFAGGPPRAPLHPAPREAEAELRAALADLGIPIGDGTQVAQPATR